MKLLYFALIGISLIFIACDTDVNDEPSEPLELVSENSPIENTETKTENVIEQVTFNQIINNPFQFDDDKEQVYSFYLTKNLYYIARTTKKPKLGEVEVLEIDGESPDFGIIVLNIVLNDYVCAERIIDQIETGTDYSCFIKIYHIQKRLSLNQKDSTIYVWADLLEKPEILIL